MPDRPRRCAAFGAPLRRPRGRQDPSGALRALPRWPMRGRRPKTEAGRRTVPLPSSVANTLADHLDRYVPNAPDALVFGTSAGTFLHSANSGQIFRRAVEAVVLPPVARTSRATPGPH